MTQTDQGTKCITSLLPHIINVVAPVLLCVLLGFVWEKMKQPLHLASVTALITNIGFPALLISHLSEQHVSFAAFSQVLLAALVAVGCFGVIATAFLKVLRLPLRAYFGTMTFGNVGNIGLPVAALAFGPKGMAFAIAFYVVVVVGVFTVGTWVPQGKFSLQNVVRAPTLYAVAIGLVLLATDTPLPRPIYHTFSILGGLAIPLMLLTLGYTIAGLKPGLMA